MKSNIINQKGEVLDYIDALLELEYQKGENPNLINYPVNEQERLEMAYYDTLAANMRSKIDLNKPIGKQVV